MVGRKRKAAAVAEPETPGKTNISSFRRRSQRVTSSAKTSRYFEPESDSESTAESKPKARAKKPQPPKTVGRKAKKAKVVESEDEDEYKEEPVDDDEEDEEDEVAQPNGNATDEEEEFDEDAPPKITFVPIPQLRDTGGVEYADDRVHKNTLAFLRDLKANNKRNWLKSHDKEYRRSLSDWETYVMAMTDKIIDADSTIPELPFKDVNFRIYRDIRFSNDPTPYKTHYGAAWSRTGRKGPYACYYMHLEPGKSFIGGGLWHPDGPAVARLRASIDERPRWWRRVLTDAAFRRTFLPSAAAAKGGAEAVERAALKAFAAANTENALKTKPKGFVAEHRDIELLKLRNFTVMKKVEDDVFTRAGGQDEVAQIVGAMVGFVTHLNRIVMPDPGDDDDESGDEEGGGDGGEE
ncbi:hypothetical protein B0H67DRAFT_589390 [Lasiosphaeris hirsuta]|uniref:DUF2461 domain-containing protein n=1 Tax=Lasiosphaeris hirsuta TaxID=260670 RepID=A0AA40A2K5_9PEZI|nr:hypothetical protein B0H67DRAFT_589390 [Lasiosphaeris hirsuta]